MTYIRGDEQSTQTRTGVLWMCHASVLVRLACVLAISIVTLVCVGGCASTPSTVARHQVSEASAAIDAFSLLQTAADHEALYTLAGGLKPMSTGIWRGSFAVDDPVLADLRDARAALALLRNDTWYADVQVFDNIHDGERSVHAFVVHRAAMARMIERFEVFWNPWGITPCTHPSEVVAVVDRMPRADRWRGYGYLFGYPADAVEFFVEAGLAAEDDREIGPGKDRRFIQIPTFAAETGRFTYAVPADHVPTAADEALTGEASRILAAYSERRGRMRDTRAIMSELHRLNSRFESAAITAAEVRDTQQPREGVADAVLDAR